MVAAACVRGRVCVLGRRSQRAWRLPRRPRPAQHHKMAEARLGGQHWAWSPPLAWSFPLRSFQGTRYVHPDRLRAYVARRWPGLTRNYRIRETDLTKILLLLRGWWCWGVCNSSGRTNIIMPGTRTPTTTTYAAVSVNIGMTTLLAERRDYFLGRIIDISLGMREFFSWHLRRRTYTQLMSSAVRPVNCVIMCTSDERRDTARIYTRNVGMFRDCSGRAIMFQYDISECSRSQVWADGRRLSSRCVNTREGDLPGVLSRLNSAPAY